MLKRAINQWQMLSDRKAAFAQAVAPYDAQLSTEAAAESRQASRVVDSLRVTLQPGLEHCACANPPHLITTRK